MADGKLHEVELDAMRIADRRFRDQEEDRLYKISQQEEKQAKAKPQVKPEVKAEAVVEDQKGTKK